MKLCYSFIIACASPDQRANACAMHYESRCIAFKPQLPQDTALGETEGHAPRLPQQQRACWAGFAATLIITDCMISH